MVIEGVTPELKTIEDCLNRIDFQDTFFTTNHQDSLRDICVSVLGKAPKWVKSLMKLRNRIVGLFGLKTGQVQSEEISFEVGGKIAFFQIYTILEDEILLGADDDHLNFRVIIKKNHSATNNVSVTTLVEFHNLFGRIYFTIIKPFHKWVLKAMVKQAYKK
jgi:hypothetical protein